VSSEHKAQTALTAGADATINYRTEGTVQRIRDLTGGQGVDHIVEVDFAGNFTISREILCSNGVLAIYAAGVAPQPPVPLQFKASNVTVRFVLVYDMPEPAKEAAVQAITQLLEAGKLRHLSGPRFPLESAVQAHQAVEEGAIGKVVLEVAECA
jgi:NADPH:quinone reductase-like Zn-dependent oxidoreductase